MKQKICFLGLIVLIPLILTSCFNIRTNQKLVDCPVPEQNCSPTKWTGIAFDTSAITSKVLGYYYVIDLVKQINSPENEWSLSFIDDRYAAFMYDDNARQKLMYVRMVRPDRFSIETGFSVPLDGHVGPLSYKKGKAVISAVKDLSPERIKLKLPDSRIQELATDDFYEQYGIDNSSSAAMEKLIELPDNNITGNSNIYLASLDKTVLSNLREMGKGINQEYYSWESQPALSPEANVIFFATDRGDGIGGTDIWFTIDLGNGWSDPFNCGNTINSRCDELSPFVTNNGKRLLFSSAGHETVGGYDIFSIEISEQFWLDVKSKSISKLQNPGNYFSSRKNLRPPLNTEFDELFPSCPGDCDSILYYSSNQNSKTSSIIQMAGGFDLFVRHKVPSPYVIASATKKPGNVEIDFKAPDMSSDLKSPQYKPPEKFTLEGTVRDHSTQQPVQDANVTVKELPEEKIRLQTSTDASGKYKVELEKDKEFEISAQGKDLFFDSFKLRVDSDDPVKNITRDLRLPELFELRVNFPFDNYTNPYRFTLDSSGIETNRTWESELDLLANNIKNSSDKLSKVILVGHTDYSGSNDYNDRLGMRRVEFVIEELVKRGVPKELLEGRSAGENELLAKLPSEDDSFYMRRLRRVTLEKILK